MIANQTGDGQVGFVPMSYRLFSTGRKLREKNKLKLLHTKSNTVVKETNKRYKYPFRLSH